MILGIVLCAIAQIIVIIYSSPIILHIGHAEELVALFFGASVIGAILSIASLFLSISRIKTGNRTFGILGVIFSSLALALYIYFLVVWYNSAAMAIGATFFTNLLLFNTF